MSSLSFSADNPVILLFSSAFLLVSSVFSVFSLVFSLVSSVVSVGLVCFSWKLVDFKASFGFSWVSLGDFPSEKKEPIK
ncbi:hypothetical protein [Helicobacter pylori]|uniref:hypothetical protein n=1 Tax=Helicobacter pylori TaxID=210 RepID=UPI001E2F899B|nr:hypothetical protein [Helicobacter pylori]